MTNSLRRAALIWMTGLLTIVGIGAILVAYVYARDEAAEFLDGQLRQIALTAGTGLSPAAGSAVADQDPEDRFAITIWDGAGRVVNQSPPDVRIPRQAKPGFGYVSAGGESWRVYTVGDQARTVQVAQRETVRAEIADSAALGAAAPILIVIPLSWLVVGWAMNRMIGRLNDLAEDVAARSAKATEPIPIAGVPSEVKPLVESMNGLIARLQAAAEAQRRFLADAAHELRTPLAAMQIQVENLAGGGVAGQDERVAALAAGVKRAGALVNQLLSLERLEGSAAGVGGTFDVGALLLDCVADCAPLALVNDVDIGIDFTADAKIQGVERDVRALFASLIDNATRYTPPGGKIDVALSRREGRPVVEIVDTGPGLPKGAETRIFDRFYRGAPHDTEGTGLGLAIARRIAERHGFELTVENRADGSNGVIARVVMPSDADRPGVGAA
ncbi:ATP-binding protein [Rhodoblastus sp.]|uniref:ATP-binding protein n=1 Tax=Rhodoblastus sp. TaxID=1962975 RepID=UPI0025E7C6BC|nr:ATP-binding protein [Rhodoblastus sp.]